MDFVTALWNSDLILMGAASLTAGLSISTAVEGDPNRAGIYGGIAIFVILALFL